MKLDVTNRRRVGHSCPHRIRPRRELPYGCVEKVGGRRTIDSYSWIKEGEFNHFYHKRDGIAFYSPFPDGPHRPSRVLGTKISSGLARPSLVESIFYWQLRVFSPLLLA